MKSNWSKYMTVWANEPEWNNFAWHMNTAGIELSFSIVVYKRRTAFVIENANPQMVRFYSWPTPATSNIITFGSLQTLNCPYVWAIWKWQVTTQVCTFSLVVQNKIHFCVAWWDLLKSCPICGSLIWCADVTCDDRRLRVRFLWNDR